METQIQKRRQEKIKQLIDRLPIINTFEPPYSEWIIIDRYVERAPIGSDCIDRIRHRFGGGRWGIVGKEEVRSYIYCGYSDFFFNPSIRFIGRRVDWNDSLVFVYEPSQVKFLYYWVLVWIRDFFGTLNRRVLMTLSVWDLADWVPDKVLEWRDLKIIGWFKRIVDERRGL